MCVSVNVASIVKPIRLEKPCVNTVHLLLPMSLQLHLVPRWIKGQWQTVIRQKWFDAIIPLIILWRLSLFKRDSLNAKTQQAKCLSCSCLTEVDSPDTVSNPVQWRRPTHHPHDVGDHQQHCTGDTRFGRQANLRDETSISFMALLLYQWYDAVVTHIKLCYSHEKPSGQKSHTCHRSAWDSKCFSLPQHSGRARLWSDKFPRWPKWRSWCSLTHRSPQWSKAESGRKPSLRWKSFLFFFFYWYQDQKEQKIFFMKCSAHDREGYLEVEVQGINHICSRWKTLVDEIRSPWLWLTNTCWLTLQMISHAENQKHLSQFIKISLLDWPLKLDQFGWDATWGYCTHAHTAICG